MLSDDDPHSKRLHRYSLTSHAYYCMNKIPAITETILKLSTLQHIDNVTEAACDIYCTFLSNSVHPRLQNSFLKKLKICTVPFKHPSKMCK